MTDLRFPKPLRRKKRKIHKKSILQAKDGTCYLCGRLNNDYRRHEVTQEHHVFGGPNRGISEAEGFKVYLCLTHHTAGAEAVHNNSKNMRFLQREAQSIFEETHTREEFMDLIGRNFLENQEAKPEIERRLTNDKRNDERDHQRHT